MITIVEPTYFWPETTLKMFPFLVEHVERCGRICYKTEDRITDDSAAQFVEKICRNQHESVLEHASVTAIVVCSRACSHQLVRHRIAAYSQESMRWVNYGKHNSLKVICPLGIGVKPGDYDSYGTMIRQGGVTIDLTTRQTQWIHHVCWAYEEYKRELAEGLKPEDARYVLPNATKTELAVTFNLRQWRHVFKERALNTHAQWEIRMIFHDILEDMANRIPAVFEDLRGSVNQVN
jgi:thymidylate synthase (FAD)